jgi:hypothetical protein
VSEPGVLGNDSDEDDDTLTAQIVIPPSDGTATIDTFTGELTYTPDENFNGEDSIFYLVSDGNGGFDFATVNITVTPANDDPRRRTTRPRPTRTAPFPSMSSPMTRISTRTS